MPKISRDAERARDSNRKERCALNKKGVRKRYRERERDKNRKRSQKRERERECNRGGIESYSN